MDRSGGEDEEIKMVFLENRNLNEEINRLHIEIGKLKDWTGILREFIMKKM